MEFKAVLESTKIKKVERDKGLLKTEGKATTSLLEMNHNADRWVIPRAGRNLKKAAYIKKKKKKKQPMSARFSS